MAAINAKMGVRCPDRAIGMQFAHPHEAGISPIQQGYQRSSVSKPLFHFLERPKDRRRILFTERSPSLLAPRLPAFSNRSRLSSKQLTGDTVSLSRDRLSSACNIKRDKVVFRL